ncbi:hypothetical protein [Photobacterium leiognathi]|uniref:hypothetical protein n=1 Tax=Photobacterium leiognathi TaxID=553611 RepID=UPI0029821831|nr:hypothetical protein [Photobacterium leiognathi]
MKNTIENASKVLWEHEAVIKKNLSVQFRKIVSDFDISSTAAMTEADYYEWLDEELQILFRNSCEQILESNDIEDCNLDDVEGIFEMQGDIIAALAVDFSYLINTQVSVIFEHAVAAGFLRGTLEEQAQDFADHLSYKITCDEAGATVEIDGRKGNVHLSSAEEVLKFHILLVGNKILTRQ